MKKLMWKSHQDRQTPIGSLKTICRYEIQNRDNCDPYRWDWQKICIVNPRIGLYSPESERFLTSDIKGEFRVRSFTVEGNPSNWCPVTIVACEEAVIPLQASHPFPYLMKHAKDNNNPPSGDGTVSNVKKITWTDFSGWTNFIYYELEIGSGNEGAVSVICYSNYYIVGKDVICRVRAHFASKIIPSSPWVTPKEEKLYKKEPPTFKLQGFKIYDPRDRMYKVSDNPALVMADMANRGAFKTDWRLDDSFWKEIASLADFCDGMEPIVRPCPFVFKDSSCGYEGDRECSKTFEECRALGNEDRFGGSGKEH